MERLLERYSKESMKIAMLKHEEVFKAQVHELHRLYRTQKTLMDDMESQGLKRPKKSSRRHGCDFERENTEDDISLNLSGCNHKEQKRPFLGIDLERPAEDYMRDDSEEAALQVENESEIELTLGSGYSQGHKDESSLASVSGPSFSSSSTDSGVMQKYASTPQRNPKEMLTGHDWGLFQIPDANASFQREKRASFISDEQMRKERVNQPPWLFHVTSLNMA